MGLLRRVSRLHLGSAPRPEVGDIQDFEWNAKKHEFEFQIEIEYLPPHPKAGKGQFFHWISWNDVTRFLQFSIAMWFMFRDKLTNYIPEEFETKCPNINARFAVLAAVTNEAEEEGRDPDEAVRAAEEGIDGE